MATPFLPLDSNVRLEEPKGKLTVPEGTLVWNLNQACDSKGWGGVSPDVALRLTSFCDGRLQALEPIDGRSAPPEFTDAVTGQYDVRTWRKGELLLSIEGEKSVYLKVPTIATVVSWTSPERLPVLTKSWKPAIFLLNSCYVAVRYIPDSVLLLTRPDESSTAWNVTPVSYGRGFISLDPCNEKVISYGSFAIPEAVNTLALPQQPGPSKNDFFIQYFPWGLLVIPKHIDISKGGLCGGGNSKLAMVIHPPNVFITVQLLFPAKLAKTLQYETDFVITAKKASESDIVIYLIVDGQLVSYDYSFDIRINKPEKPPVNVLAKFKTFFSSDELTKIKAAKADKKPYNPRITFAESDVQKVIVQEGSPLSQGHLLTEQTAAVYDAETGMYYSNPIGMKLTKVFKEVVVPTPKKSSEKPVEADPTASSSPTTNAQPAAETVAAPNAPSASTEEPAAEPSATPNAPSASTEEPAAEPSATPNAPAASTEEPAAEPSATPNAPAASTEEPAAEPSATPNAPAASTEEPAAEPSATPNATATSPVEGENKLGTAAPANDKEVAATQDQGDDVKKPAEDTAADGLPASQ
ncbi:conserved hypothetical protein [Neospora caninum Liverpool]|uniref:S15 sporozoite-expressed protein n=1 Tax=Neospora caninum (strain Liverpool) TaxID=572307 RepID=F0VFH1_NEOCL|nr:conserved hypothetical protein [Neospora caninum Liverpool]CBZ52465.1 conserved hypothetical protein [Neospora caninum Liverpool]CEL66440.1 TPA: S15 sporozoite-expressed protein [Neospora caninum Liverpool]|eukprot:XP_003882497.1 conserved hypothetical protein [Neospora caninum Liverpool]